MNAQSQWKKIIPRDDQEQMKFYARSEEMERESFPLFGGGERERPMAIAYPLPNLKPKEVDRGDVMILVTV